MSRRWVLDASAAVHLVLRSSDATAILEALEGAALVLAPSLYGSETANALWKYVNSGYLSLDGATEHYEEALSLVDRLIPDRDIAVEALSLAYQSNHPVYDALYAVLARRHACGVITRDRRLAALARDLGLHTLG